MLTLKGTYKKNIFKSGNGYVIGLIKVNESQDEELQPYLNKQLTFTGYFHELNIDDNYTLKGDLVVHPKYGIQFNVKEYVLIKPEDKDGLIEFLSSDR